MELFNQILITSDFQKAIQEIESQAKLEGFEILSIIKENNFLVQDVDLAIEKAYISSQKEQIIVLGAKNFSEIVQNRLLKLLEEPPKNKRFILLFTNKASILSTIKSRLPIIILDRVDDSNIQIPNLKNLTIKECYEFVQKNKRASNQEMRLIIQKIFKDAIKSREFMFRESDLKAFENAIVALDYGSVAGFVLIGILLRLLEIKRS
jgi:DNA polymerase-3 subunit delta'